MTTMRFSEAIRLGAMMRPQGFGALQSFVGLFRKTKTTCAIGAALEAFPCKEVKDVSQIPKFGMRGEKPEIGGVTVMVPDHWSVVMWASAACPACKDFEVRGPVHRIIAMHLNDKHHWTRERIADWVETLEKGIDALQGTNTANQVVEYK